MKKSMFLFLAIVALMVVMVASCKKTPAPTAKISASIEGYTVTFTPTVTDVDTYLWNFGDGDDETSTEANPVHTYAMSGTYTVTLIVKGEGGEETVTTKITLAVSLTEMLTGGPAAENGKTWVLNTLYTDGDG